MSWHTRPVRSVRRRRLVPALITALAVAGAGCGSDDGSDAERFCGEIGLDPAAVVAPPLGTEEELELALERYRALAELAPVAIEGEWRVVLLSLETATTVEPSDPESVQRAVAQAYASERSAVAVHAWVMANCGVDLGPVATITPQGPSVTPPPATVPDGESSVDG